MTAQSFKVAPPPLRHTKIPPNLGKPGIDSKFQEREKKYFKIC